MGKDIFPGTHVVQVEQVDSERREVMNFNMFPKNIFNFLNQDSPSSQSESQSLDNSNRFKNIEDLLSDHVGLPQVVIVTLHLVTGSGWAEGIILRHF